MKDLSIVIVNWNSKDFVRDCLKSIHRTCQVTRPQVIVVDGASFDGCDEMLQEEFDDVVYVQSFENIGFGRCNNLGFKEVKTEYVLFLNPDTEIQGEALEDLLSYLKEHPDAGIVGAKLLNSDGSLQTSSVQAYPTPLNQALDSNFLRRFLGSGDFFGTRALSLNQTREVEGISGACMLMRSEVFREIGGFDSAYFMYAEDMDLSWKVSETGRKNYYFPQAEIIHHGGGSSAGEFSQFSNLEMRKSLHHFITKRQGYLAGIRYRLFLGVSAIVRNVLLMGAALLSPKRSERNYLGSARKWRSTLKWCLVPKPSR